LQFELTESLFPTGLHLSLLSIIGIGAILVPLVMFFAGVMLSVSAFAKNVREAQTYLTLVSFLVIMPAIFSQFIGFTESQNALWVRLTHSRMELASSFVAGLMLGVGLLHMLPHAVHELGSKRIDEIIYCLLAGFFVMFFIERFFCFHHHEFPDDTPDEQHHHHAHGHDHQLTWSGAAVGLSLHSVIAGIALAASLKTEATNAASGGLPALGTFLVIFLHKPFDSLTLGTLMAKGGWTPKARHLVNALFALAIPIGVVLFHIGLGTAGSPWLAWALAFSAGTFLCIAMSDILPELQFHQHDRIKLSCALLLGLALAFAVGLFEGHSHGGENEHPPDHSGHKPIANLRLATYCVVKLKNWGDRNQPRGVSPRLSWHEPGANAPRLTP
ncbi:MAG: ZIP family metal transporter, partial [Planctomycetes bacterium]|nr:ZIP family metal transporter [Planctomycetota bacterium]